MSFSKHLRKLFGSSTSNSSKDAKYQTLVDMRAHARLNSKFETIFWVTSPDVKNLKLVNLSYGGAAISFASLDKAAKQISVTIHALDRNIATQARIIRREEYSAGISFIHDTPDTLLFLREVVEQMKGGASLVQLPETHLKEDYRALGAIFWRGDGPTDVQFFPRGFLGKSTVPALQVTFRDGKDYHQIAIGDGKIVTSKSREYQNPETHRMTDMMNTSNGIDMDSLRKALFVMNGIENTKLLEMIQPCMHVALAPFKSNLRLLK